MNLYTTYHKKSYIPLPKLCYHGMLRQVLELVTESGGVSAQLNEVHHQSPVPAVSLHCSVCSAGDAALWRTVSTRLRVTLTCHLVHVHLL